MNRCVSHSFKCFICSAYVCVWCACGVIELGTLLLLQCSIIWKIIIYLRFEFKCECTCAIEEKHSRRFLFPFFLSFIHSFVNLISNRLCQILTEMDTVRVCMYESERSLSRVYKRQRNETRRVTRSATEFSPKQEDKLEKPEQTNKTTDSKCA